jgi:hypothetical protein
MIDPTTHSSDRKEHWSDKLLRVGEVSVVISITFTSLLAIGYGLIWLAWCNQQTRAIRLTGLAKTMNENWKVILILLVPLFYRTVRMFLERAQEFAGIKAPIQQPPLGEKGHEIRQAEFQKLPEGPTGPTGSPPGGAK